MLRNEVASNSSAPVVVETTAPQPLKTLVQRTRGRCEEFREMISQYNWNIDLMMAIMKAESGCNPNATNQNTDGSNDIGLFQINSVHKLSNRDNPELNIKYAYRIYKSQGLRAWSAYNNNSYVKFLKQESE